MAVVSVGSRGTTLSRRPKASQRPPKRERGQAQSLKLVISGDSNETANRRPAPGVGSAYLPCLLLSQGNKLH